ncbi:hypothetical protein TSAR_013306 [Trichomalopsis sarcophagae]|uniref:Uncharacterized protein n=1 Tax=Trichomalopsis sarcophagae TaxID=543379 RepID=A0A232EP75_9HYME|nr:hypothetical protein TSAR_013306 [Trichomalopsis sarcophagae]
MVYFKFFLLVAVCSSLVASQNVHHRRDTDPATLDDANALRKDEKRDDEVAKKSAVEIADQPPAAATDGATEGAKDQTVDARKTAAAAPKKRFVDNDKDAAQSA